MFWCEIEKVVRVQIKAKPYQYDDCKDNEACPVFHGCKEGKQEDPENGVIGFANKGERVGECLLNGNVVACIFSKPCEPHGRMQFDDYSIDCPNNRNPDHATLLRPG